MDPASEARPPEPRVIKRYANRKLYDTRDSRYVTLREIDALIRSGEDVRIIDNGTKDDLTSVTLAQVLLEREKNGANLFPSSIRELVNKLIRRSDPPPEAPDAPVTPPAAPAVPSATKRVAEFVEHGREALDEWQRRIDERVRATLQNVAPWTQLQTEVRRLAQRVEELERALAVRERPEAGE